MSRPTAYVTTDDHGGGEIVQPDMLPGLRLCHRVIKRFRLVFHWGEVPGACTDYISNFFSRDIVSDILILSERQWWGAVVVRLRQLNCGILLWTVQNIGIVCQLHIRPMFSLECLILSVTRRCNDPRVAPWEYLERSSLQPPSKNEEEPLDL